MGEKISLTGFSLLAQSAIGLAIMIQILDTNGEFRIAAVILIVLLGALGQAVSLLHLGKPLMAYRALYNIKSSWLSREILFLVAFFILSLVRLYGEWQGMHGTATTFGWLMVIAGCLCLFSMASAYMETELPAWGTFYTHLSFYMTAISLGGGLFAVMAAQMPSAVPPGMIPQAFALAAASVLAQIIGFTAYLPALADRGDAAQASVLFLKRMISPILISHGLMVAGSFFVPLLILAGAATGSEKIWIYTSFIFLAIGQMMSRHIYYGAGVHRMPGRAIASGNH